MPKPATTPLGYLLELLNIKKTELASAIYVDRTLVSKWCSGAQGFNKCSKYYESVLSFLLEADSAQGGSLQIFFTNHFHNIELSLSEALDLFMAYDTVPALKPKPPADLFYHEITVSESKAGRYAALMQMLEEALRMPYKRKHKITLYDGMQFFWMTDNAAWFDNFMNMLTSLLENGHKITLISDTYTRAEPNTFANALMPLYRFKELTEYFHPNQDLGFFFSYYMLKDRVAIYGNSTPTSIFYTASFRDKGALLAADCSIQQMLQNSTPYRLLTNRIQLNDILLLMDSVSTNDDTVYAYTNSLFFASMSESLLSEIMLQNKISKDRERSLLNLRNTLVQNPQNSPACFRNLCYRRDIEEMLSAETHLLPEASALARKSVYITHQQAVRHIQDTIKLLNNERYSIGLIPDPISANQRGYSFLCKKNHYLFSVNRYFRFLNEPLIVNHASNRLDKVWNHLLQAENTDNACIRSWLEGLIY